jgi:peptide/nickel transport system permease protein
MLRYTLKRIFQTIPVLLGVSVLVFLFLYLIPGDPATSLLGERATPENVARLKEQLGLNRPLFINLPYDYAYQCPNSYTGTVIDFAVFTLPTGCTRTVTYKPDWALLRNKESTSVKAIRVINPGQPDEKTEELDLPKALRLAEAKTLEDLNLQPGVPKQFTTFNGTLTITLVKNSQLISDPLDSQYFNYLGRILRLDLGNSLIGNTSIKDEFAVRFPATVELSLAALFIAVIIGVPIGILSAVRRNSAIDTLSMFGALIGVSLPIFVLGLIFIYFFSVQLKLLPTGQRLDNGLPAFQPLTGLYTLDGLLRGRTDIFWNALKHLIMPSIVLSTIPLAIIARITRSSMLEVLNQDYVRTARSKGMRERRVVLYHALRNALLPVVTVIGLQLGTLLSGAVLTETIFSWQGIGSWLYTAITGRDYPTIQSVSLLITLIYVTINLLVDLSYAVLNPRIRYS